MHIGPFFFSYGLGHVLKQSRLSFHKGKREGEKKKKGGEGYFYRDFHHFHFRFFFPDASPQLLLLEGAFLLSSSFFLFSFFVSLHRFFVVVFSFFPFFTLGSCSRAARFSSFQACRSACTPRRRVNVELTTR